MAPTGQEKKASITRRRKKQILDAALEVFTRKGFAEATTAEIVQKAGVAEGTICNQFQSKRELLLAAVKSFIITEPFLNIFEHVEETDYPAFLTAVPENPIDFIDDV